MNKSGRTERGQALVIIVFAILALLVVAGLAIDGGTVYLERRRMQNAADAAALAGTRKLAEAMCAKPGVNDAAIAAEVIHYAEANGVQYANSNVVADYVAFNESVLGRVGSGAIPTGATGISVTTKISRKTYFMSLVGIDLAGASAGALAMTSRPLVGGGIRPIGIPVEVVNAAQQGSGDFTLHFKNCRENDLAGCIVDYTGGQVQHRGWLNLAWAWNQTEEDDGWPRALDPSGDANVLKEWMELGYDGGTFYADGLWETGYRIGDYIHAKPGTDSSIIGAAPVGQIIVAPVFDEVPEYDVIPAPKPGPAQQGGSYYYHIVGFAAFKVVEASQGGGTITGELTRMIMGEGQVSPTMGAGFGEADACKYNLQVVTLWR